MSPSDWIVKVRNKTFWILQLMLLGTKRYLCVARNAFTFSLFRMTSFHIEPTIDSEKSYIELKWDSLTTFLEENRQNIFYLFIFYVITIALFVERFIRKFLNLS